MEVALSTVGTKKKGSAFQKGSIIGTVLGNNSKLNKLYEDGELSTIIYPEKCSAYDSTPIYLGKKLGRGNAPIKIHAFINFMKDFYSVYNRNMGFKEVKNVEYLRISYMNSPSYTIRVELKCYDYADSLVLLYGVESKDVCFKDKTGIFREMVGEKYIFKSERLLVYFISLISGLSGVPMYDFTYILSKETEYVGRYPQWLGYASSSVKGEYSVVVYEDVL